MQLNYLGWDSPKLKLCHLVVTGNFPIKNTTKKENLYQEFGKSQPWYLWDKFLSGKKMNDISWNKILIFY